MADLSSMFQGMGPAGSSVLAGLQAAQNFNEQKTQDAYRQAQMEEIRQRVAQNAAMNPLELEAKQVSNRKAALEAALAEATQQNKIETSSLDLGEKRRNDSLAKMNFMATSLNNAIPTILQSGPAAGAVARQAMIEGGMNPEGVKDRAFMEKIGRMTNPQQIAQALGQLQQHLITTSEKYVTEMAKTREHSRSAENIARIGAQSREAAAAARSKGTQTIEDLVRSGKMTAEKAAVSLYGAAQFEADPQEKQRLLTMAQTYEQFAMQQRQAGQAGKPDVGQLANIPTTQLPPAMGGGGPKLGTKENPIKLD